MGKLIHMLSHEMKRNQPIDKVIKADLTIMQKHILKFILLETMHKDLYQKDIEEEFQIRKSTVTGYVSETANTAGNAAEVFVIAAAALTAAAVIVKKRKT